MPSPKIDTIEFDLPEDLEVSIYGQTVTVRGTRGDRIIGQHNWMEAEAKKMMQEASDACAAL